MNTMLPIGSVVELKGEKDYVTIIGYMHQEMDEMKLNIYQYTGCNYLNGYKNNTKLVYFDEDYIENIYYVGYATEYQRDFYRMLYEVFTEINKNKDVEKAVDVILNKYYANDEKTKEEIRQKILDY